MSKGCPKQISRYVARCYHHITKYDWDNVVVITGDVGRGKSNLALWMMDEWHKLQDKDINTIDFRDVVAMTSKEFADNISKAKNFDILINDESGDISNRTSMNQTNVIFMKAYQVIRGANLFTILCIPSIWYLDSFFRKTRVKQMFYINKRFEDKYAEYRFWNKIAYKNMLERFEAKNYRPDAYDLTYVKEGRFKKYDGVFAAEYKKMKEIKIQTTREELPTLIGGIIKNAPKTERVNRIKRYLEQGMSVEQAAKLEGCTTTTIWNYKKFLKNKNQDGAIL